ncbi:hypothetical protein [Halobaculum rubrum]|uniref:hypothetical protein n=1 Tax=Halobaculum rubrum TaxID=2872158 RepID=UPI001CA3A0CA|nr:hypothetical protein [Halobaculum rubrum]QZX98726.1 hypothetical protein K6T25_10620 [Halobaculum rubrum]
MATEPLTLLEKARGRSLTGIAKQGIGGWLLALSTSAILGVQAIVKVLLVPVDLFVNITGAVGEALILSPLGVVIAGSEASAQSVAEFEFLGLPLGTVLVLSSFAVVSLYLRQPWSSDFIPGTFTDIPFLGTEEEGET